MRQHTNAFDLIRLAAALAVLWAHQDALMGHAGPPYASELGVCAFFAISGYLNTASLLRRRAAVPFLISRALRIYPALIVCVVVTALLTAYLAPGWELLSFVGKDVTLFTGIKAGVSHVVFPTSTLPEALNGSLWTLPYEVRLYVGLAVLAAVLRYSPAVTALAALLAIGALGLLPPDLFSVKFTALFAAGALIAAVERVSGAVAALLASIVLAGVFAAIGDGLYASYLILPAAVVGIGSLPLPRWLRPPLDISYAVYLWAFPVQQISTALTGNFYVGLAFSAAVTIALAVLSAVLVEGRITLDTSPWLLSFLSRFRAPQSVQGIEIATKL